MLPRCLGGGRFVFASVFNSWPTDEPPQPTPTMQIVRFTSLTALVTLSLLAGISAALRLARPELHSADAPHIPAIASIDSTLAHLPQQAGQSTSLFPGNSAQSNFLELPTASTDFVGYWGGYPHSSIDRVNPDLVGTSPDRVSVVFGRQGDAVFMASELYSSANQTIVRRPRARMVGARLAIVEYEAADHDLYYICTHRFRLDDASRMSYQSTVDVYELNSRRLMGVVTQRAKLKRLLTPREQLQFARPARNQIPRAEISASGHFGPSD